MKGKQSDIQQFTGRTWLLGPLLSWLEVTESRFFLLTGEPGSGKSRVARWLSEGEPIPQDMEARTLLQQFRSSLKATYFCVANSGAVVPRRAVESLADQLAQRVGGFATALADSLKDLVTIQGNVFAGSIAAGGNATGVQITHLNLGSLSERLSFDRALRTPLQSLYRDGYGDKIVMIVDALDESLTYGGQACIARLLAELDDLPPEVRFVVTTRPDVRVLKYYRGYIPFDIVTAPAGADDVGQYSYNQLSVLSDEVRRAEFAGRISKAADGNFLYATLVLKDVIPRLPKIPDLTALSLPTGLRGIYRDFLNREVDAREENWDDHLKLFLGLVSIGQGTGLTRWQIEGVVGRSMDRSVRVCAQFLEGSTPSGPFRPFHRSFVDFLLNDDKNTDYHINAVEMHRWIAEYYLSNRRRWAEDDGYALRALGVHLVAAGLVDKLDALIDDPQWLDAHLMSDPTGTTFLNDLRTAWHESERKNTEAIEHRELPTQLAREVFLALAVASIRRRSGGFPSALIAAMLCEGRWTPSQAIDVARQIPEPRMRTESNGVKTVTSQ